MANRKWTAQDEETVQTIIETTDIDTLVRKNTAFSNYADLTDSMGTGYRPTLRNDRTGPKALGLALEAKGHAVRWL
jgi:hypothetical protein